MLYGYLTKLYTFLNASGITNYERKSCLAYFFLYNHVFSMNAVGVKFIHYCQCILVIESFQPAYLHVLMIS